VKWVHGILRLLGYAAGLAGMILFTRGRQSSAPPGGMTGAGSALLVISFVAFIGSYIVHVINQLTRRGR
jgi:hypothetical protein